MRKASPSCSPSTGSNVVYHQSNFTSLCYGIDGGEACTDMCVIDFGICDQTAQPDIDLTTGCPDEAGNLHDTGVDVGYDTTPDVGGLFDGAAPDRGALERGATRVFGGQAVSCD